MSEEYDMPRIFSDQEMQRRVAELKGTMDREGITCTIITSVQVIECAGLPGDGPAGTPKDSRSGRTAPLLSISYPGVFFGFNARL